MARFFPVVWGKKQIDGSHYANGYVYPNAHSNNGLLRTASVTPHETRPCEWMVTEHRPEEYYHFVAGGEAKTLEAAKAAAEAYLDS